MEPFILITLMLAGPQPLRIAGVESIRFDSHAACLFALREIDERNAEVAPGNSLNLLCVPASCDSMESCYHSK